MVARVALVAVAIVATRVVSLQLPLTLDRSNRAYATRGLQLAASPTRPGFNGFLAHNDWRKYADDESLVDADDESLVDTDDESLVDLDDESFVDADDECELYLKGSGLQLFMLVVDGGKTARRDGYNGMDKTGIADLATAARRQDGMGKTG
ncbi:hypothetical protein B0T26DRAFT_806869 [Lasiosphaeria miniovina]|uniref:Uncharacterized protein n=1 Tax=Lasiosphaeria miniovina TaxID=1954250 RepID=A0AA40DKI5_9PEZI|nr:uncharacterized protein B0T26DRAFT_806869 [Lasiosphaeria miniovina]KAK0703173.1 hypothetical protein B0T26DRAFT_806869 [Lasiosphaeria miniovina]